MAPKKRGGSSAASNPVTAAASRQATPVLGRRGSPATTQHATPSQFPTPRTPDNSDTEGTSAARPPAALSPIKGRQRKKDQSLKALSDIDAWEHSDNEIIGM